ncbi:ral guanine nucleotide dissociation stimulator-like isoform X1 [Oryctolagus cuniculus]|uniref:ral guanine nucleotide dissociation stimulator-like isoform X1 n=1 Tax=Oryctolagus cuniculus TaxID=9986 RepID=UPI00387A15E7
MLYLAEVCAMRTLQPDTKEMLLDALVPGPLGKRICYFNTFLCTYSDFSTIPYYLDQIFDRNMASCLQRCKAKYKAEFCDRTDLPLLKMKVGSKQVRLPRGDLQTHACFLRVRMAYPNPTQAEAVGKMHCTPRDSLGGLWGWSPFRGNGITPGFGEAIGKCLMLLTLSLLPAPALFARLQSCQTLALEPDSPLLTELEPLLETGSISKLRLPPCTESAPKTTTKVSCACPGPANNQPRKMASITTFPAKLLAEQFTLMDAVSSGLVSAGPGPNTPLAPASPQLPRPESSGLAAVQASGPTTYVTGPMSSLPRLPFSHGWQRGHPNHTSCTVTLQIN